MSKDYQLGMFNDKLGMVVCKCCFIVLEIIPNS
jgi:hypothetical protein